MLALQDEFVERIQQHRLLLNKLVFVYADQAEDRNDLRQEILLQAWRSYPNYREEAKFSTWLYRLGLNVALTMLARTRRTQFGELTEPAPGDDNPFETNDQLQYVLHQLSPVDRTLLVMSMEGYNDGEISETLGISPGNTRTKLHRIRQKIGQLWT